MNKFEDMRAFIRIVEAGSITKAASQLNIAKSALSKRLSTLELSLGISLLNRTTRSQVLTDNGRVYYQQCLRIIDDVTEMESTLQNKQCALSGTIKITVPLSFGLSHLAPAITEFNRLHDQIKFDIDFNDRKTSIINEGYDMAVRIGKLHDSSLIAKKITTVKTVLVASQEYLDKHGTPTSPYELLTNHVKLHYSNAPGTLYFEHRSNRKNKDSEKISINIPVALIANNGDYLCQAAVASMGLISTPDFICHKYIKNRQLIPVLADCFMPTVLGVYAIYPQTRHLNKRIRMLIDFLVEYFGKKSVWDV